MSNINTIKLSEGSGGLEMQRLIKTIRKNFATTSKWANTHDDGAVFKIGNQNLVFTSDSFTVSPVFFPGGNIGKIAFCGTVNDIAVMGTNPIGLSLSLIMEEGFPKDDLFKITQTIAKLSKENKIPIVTGDTKVMEKGKLDQIIINTSGVGLTDKIIDEKIEIGDQIIISGGIGEHGASLLARRFDMITNLGTDSKVIWPEIKKIKSLIKKAKDITRGGLSAILNEISESSNYQLSITEKNIPVKKSVRAITDILGLDYLELACEGRFLCIVSKQNSQKVLNKLKKFNPKASIIGEVKKGKAVIVKTDFGNKLLPTPTGNIVPRIC